MNNKRIKYPQPMLPYVNYALFNDNDDGLEDDFETLFELEFEAFDNYRQFLKELERVLLDATMIQIPELVVAHLCGYLGSVIAVYKGNQSKQLEPDIIKLLKRHADLAYEKFGQYTLSSSASESQRKSNLNALREDSPGSIAHQTLRLGRIIREMMRRLSENRDDKLGFTRQMPEELFCPVKELLEFLIPLLNKHHHEWQEKLGSKSINYALNQLTIQIGWLIGYFARMLDKQSPDKGQYFRYGLTCFSLYRERTHELLQAMRDKGQVLTSMDVVDDEEEPAIDRKLNPLLHEIHELSSKTHAAAPPAVTSFQKETAIVHAKIEKLLIELLMEKMAVKVVLMSVFYFWFKLDAPMRVEDPTLIEAHTPFEEMLNIIKIVKTTTQSLPEPELSSDLNQLNVKMQLLKSQQLPDPSSLDYVPTDQVHDNTPKVNTAFTLTSDLLKEDIHPEIIANVLFHQWLRLSAFFGISENEWQKMDHYFPEIITAVRDYLSTALRKGSKN